MTKKNTWHQDQERSDNKTFAPKWNKDTILWIMNELKHMNEVSDIEAALVKGHLVSWRSAQEWVEMARRVMKDMGNGLTIDLAMARDKQRRNLWRSKRAKK